MPQALDAVLRELALVDLATLVEARRALDDDFYDPRELARHLVQVGHLTAFQANQLVQGRGHSLLLGPYVILERIGAGGMGEVYKARDRRLHRLVALKVIQGEQLGDSNTVRRFVLEAQAAAQLSHPNIVIVHDAGQQDDVHFLAMEYIDGIDLGRLVLQAGPLPVQMACDFVRQACAGLEHAHERGQIHRDIKPANLLVAGPPRSVPRWEGDRARIEQYFGGTVKILDMGLVRLQTPLPGRSGETPLTHHGVVIGTMDYLAPEQARNPSGVDARADLYSLGCTLYHLLSGQPPFPGGMPVEKLLRHQTDQPIPLLALRPDLPVELQSVVARLMAKQPEDRFESAAQVAAALSPFTRQGAPTLKEIPIVSASVVINPNPRPALPGYDQIPPTQVINRPPPSSIRLRLRRSWPAMAVVTLAVVLLAAALVLWLPTPGVPPVSARPAVSGVALETYLPDDAAGVIEFRPSCLRQTIVKEKLSGAPGWLKHWLPPLPGLSNLGEAGALRVIYSADAPNDPLVLASGKIDPHYFRVAHPGLVKLGAERYSLTGFKGGEQTYYLAVGLPWLAVSASQEQINAIGEPREGPNAELLAAMKRAREWETAWFAVCLDQLGTVPPLPDGELEELVRPILKLTHGIEGGAKCGDHEISGELRFRALSAEKANALEQAVENLRDEMNASPAEDLNFYRRHKEVFDLLRRGRVSRVGQDVIWRFTMAREKRPLPKGVLQGTVATPGG